MFHIIIYNDNIMHVNTKIQQILVLVMFLQINYVAGE
jgi:hypothetical protein